MNWQLSYHSKHFFTLLHISNRNSLQKLMRSKNRIDLGSRWKSKTCFRRTFSVGIFVSKKSISHPSFSKVIKYSGDLFCPEIEGIQFLCFWNPSTWKRWLRQAKNMDVLKLILDQFSSLILCLLSMECPLCLRYSLIFIILNNQPKMFE